MSTFGMWRLLERRALPAAAPAPLRRRLSKYRPRRSAATWVTCALFILILAIMVFTRTRTQRPDLASFAIRAARRMHVRVHPPRVPGRPVRPAVVADVSDEDGMLDEEGITRDITADVHDPHAGRRYGEYFAGVRTPGAAAHGAAGATRLTARDFGGAFGLAVARGAVVSSGMRRRMRGHDVTRDAFYARLRRAGMLERYAARYASALVVGAKATVYVGRAGRGVLRRGCFASGSLRNGLVLGEYGGRYRPLREITVRLASSAGANTDILTWE